MSKKLTTDLRQLSPEELRKKVDDLKTELVEHRRALHMNELPNPHVVKKTRAQIAIALTLLREQEQREPASTVTEPKQSEKEKEA